MNADVAISDACELERRDELDTALCHHSRASFLMLLSPDAVSSSHFRSGRCAQCDFSVSTSLAGRLVGPWDGWRRSCLLDESVGLFY